MTMPTNMTTPTDTTAPTDMNNENAPADMPDMLNNTDTKNHIMGEPLVIGGGDSPILQDVSIVINGGLNN